MKKISLVLILVAGIAFGMTSFAEESETSSSAIVTVKEEGVAEPSTTENTVEPIEETKADPQIVPPVMINGVTDAEWLARLLRNSIITQAEYDDNIAQLEAATSTDERNTITNRLLETNSAVNGFTFAFGERYANAKVIVDLLREANHITEKEAQDFYAQLDACDSLEDLQKVSDALDPYVKKYSGEGESSDSREESTEGSTTTATSTTVKAEIKVPTDNDKKGKLPQTGEKISMSLALIGAVLVSATVVAFGRKKIKI